MITDIASYLAFFDAVQRRTLRDVAALPPEAAGWRSSAGVGEGAWRIGQIVGHIGGSRLYFASAYSGEGWINPRQTLDTADQAAWLPYLQETAAGFRERLSGTPDDWLRRKVAMIDTPGSLSGWRILMMMLEHEVHHRSQVDTYAGLEGWPVPDIFGRSAEAIAARQQEQRARHGES
jgi:uncharacterized damage-inducible protein DinB